MGENMGEIVKIKNALLSVYYKTDAFLELVKALHENDVKLYASGGTAKKISELSIPVEDVANYTGYPPLFNHRVVTLHPKVEGGILLERDSSEQVKEAEKYGVVPFDLVVVNLYPFKEAVSNGDSHEEIVEKIDVGGSALIRSAAKNHKFVGVIVDPEDYEAVAKEVKDGLSHETRVKLAQKAFKISSDYDNEIQVYLKNA